MVKKEDSNQFITDTKQQLTGNFTKTLGIIVGVIGWAIWLAAACYWIVLYVARPEMEFTPFQPVRVGLCLTPLIWIFGLACGLANFQEARQAKMKSYRKSLAIIVLNCAGFGIWLVVFCIFLFAMSLPF